MVGWWVGQSHLLAVGLSVISCDGQTVGLALFGSVGRGPAGRRRCGIFSSSLLLHCDTLLLNCVFFILGVTRAVRKLPGQSVRRIASSTTAGAAELSGQTFHSPKQKNLQMHQAMINGIKHIRAIPV